MSLSPSPELSEQERDAYYARIRAVEHPIAGVFCVACHVGGRMCPDCQSLTVEWLDRHGLVWGKTAAHPFAGPA